MTHELTFFMDDDGIIYVQNSRGERGHGVTMEQAVAHLRGVTRGLTDIPVPQWDTRNGHDLQSALGGERNAKPATR